MIAQIENAVIARLKSAEAMLGYKWKTAETYPVDWDKFIKEKKGQINAPGFWFGLAGAPRFPTDEDDSGAFTKLECSFGLTVIAQHFGNEEMRRHGNPKQGVIGSYQMMMDCVSLLDGKDLGLDIAKLKFTQLRLVKAIAEINSGKSSMIAAEIRTSFLIPRLPADLAEADPDDFLTFHANWDIPPFGGIDANPGTPGIQLPDDVHADATDEVELPQ